jgi:hypothetical protein
MKREQWKDLMEGIGFMAIIASLIFLGVETRNNAIQAELNTRALQIAAYQDLIDNNEGQLRSVLAPLNLGESRIQAFWEANQQNFADGYRQYINSVITEINTSR